MKHDWEKSVKGFNEEFFALTETLELLWNAVRLSSPEHRVWVQKVQDILAGMRKPVSNGIDRSIAQGIINRSESK